MNITNPYGPNTTVLLPGDCNAHCDFCFWHRDGANIKFDHTFSDSVREQLMRLPTEFNCISVSGGEPTLSPEFTRFSLMLLAHRKELGFKRTVLTTHGGNLLRNLDVAVAAYDHINISRHAIGHAKNAKIFKTYKIPRDDDVKNLIKQIHKTSSTDVTLNCVVPPDVKTAFIDEFIEYAKKLGADAVSFRKYASNTKPTVAERAYAKRYGYESETKCSVCRGATMLKDGFQVRWKGSVEEPSLETNGVYEAVVHPDAKVYTDWNRQVPFPFDAKKRKKKRIPLHATTTSASGCGSGGCGSSENSGCGGGGGCGNNFS